MYNAMWNRYEDPDDDPDDEPEYCPVCQAELDWVDCWQCHGEGEFDLYEDNPIEYGPGEVEQCDVCKGEGGYLECPNVPHLKQEATACEQ